mmetsp:Transcript_12293/g.12385  ORF Transcript_12293/g.12385 Transcript_12293/m.12385 type:complete len:342 (-) Transcript_12293:208-1233(-)|eukprot:CAMPEP_0182418350 /NCGR_PEP_ID=MMETSP1167-20130531/2805_1 /TAXON_ID=2988 /ORGANISM="Mallomonas Sp, Strain CCMP3275" /LENGTH=341 /DNA_ID=CAMNT_0024592517 /DNA_START=36 /DNA_END=1064 /DNA_ORIENTATION=+
MSLKTVQTQAKYGLIKKSSTASKKKKLPNLSRASCFLADDDEEDYSPIDSNSKNVNKLLGSRNKNFDKSVEKIHAAAIAEDESIFNYDDAYDSFKEKAVQSHPLSNSSAQKPKYIENLMVTAKAREKEKDRIYERNLLKERKKEDEEFGDTARYVTAAYKKRLMEDRKWEYEDRLAEAVEERTDVRARGMQGFYSNLLTKNLAMGGDVKTSAVSAYTSGSRRQEQVMGESRDASEKDGESERGVGSDSPEERSKRQKLEDSEIDSESESKIKVEDVDLLPAASSAVSTTPEKGTEADDGSGSGTAARIVEEVVTEIKSREETVMSAKERYLARKYGNKPSS